MSEHGGEHDGEYDSKQTAKPHRGGWGDGSKGRRALQAVLNRTDESIPLSHLALREQVDYTLVCRARTIQKHAPDRIEAVMSGTASFESAYRAACVASKRATREAVQQQRSEPAWGPYLKKRQAIKDLDPDHVLPEEVRQNLAARLQAARREEIAVLQDAEKRIAHARQHKQDLVDRLAAMSVDELDALIRARTTEPVEEAQAG